MAPTDPRTVYYSDGFTVLASADGGATVHEVAPVSQLFATISALAVSPLAAAEVLAATNQGLFKTTDGGATWEQLPVGGTPVALAVDPFDAATVYAGAGDGSFFASHDRGATWSRTGSGLGAGSLDVIAADPATPGILYAGLNGESTGGVWKSLDGGATWTLAAATAKVDALAASPARAGEVLAGLEPAGIAKSEDQGATWSPANQGLSGTVVLAAAADPFSAGTFYAAVYSHNQHDFERTGIDDQLLPLGLQRTRDGGATWARADSGLDAAYVTKLLADPARPGTLYALTNAPPARVFATADGAGSWRPLGDPALYDVFDLALDPKRPGLVYLVGGRLVHQRTVFVVEKSIDGGATWSMLPVPAGRDGLVALAVDPLMPARVYAGGTVLLRSNRRGAGLTQIGSGFPHGFIERLIPDPTVPLRLFALTAGSQLTYSFFRSLDGGATWTGSSTGLPPATVPQNDLAAVAAGSTLFLSSQAGVFLSHSGGARWRPAGNGLLGAAGGLLFNDPPHPGTVLTNPELGGLWTYTLAP